MQNFIVYVFCCDVWQAGKPDQLAMCHATPLSLTQSKIFKEFPANGLRIIDQGSSGDHMGLKIKKSTGCFLIQPLVMSKPFAGNSSTVLDCIKDRGVQPASCHCQYARTCHVEHIINNLLNEGMSFLTNTGENIINLESKCNLNWCIIQSIANSIDIFYLYNIL